MATVNEKLIAYLEKQTELPTSTVLAKRFKITPARAGYYLTKIRKARASKEFVKPRAMAAVHGQGRNDSVEVLQFKVDVLTKENNILRQKVALLKELV